MVNSITKLQTLMVDGKVLMQGGKVGAGEGGREGKRRGGERKGRG